MRAALALALVAVLAEVSVGLPQLDGTADYGEIIALVDETTGAELGSQAGKLTYAGTLQHVANRFCTEREKKKGTGAVFCGELVALQHSWVDGEAMGTLHKYIQVLGMMQGHYCPDSKSTENAKCLVLSLLSKAIPVNLKWNVDTKRYLQMVEDVGKHYCKVHGEEALFCPLMKSLKKHFFEGVVTQDSSGFKKYVESLHAHYCAKGQSHNHPADERCNIFPLLLQALPVMNAATEQGKVLENGGAGQHVTPGDPPGNVPAVDEQLSSP